MRTLILLFSLYGACIQAQVLNCEWQNSQQYAEGYFRPAFFKMKIQMDHVQILESNYFERRYEPCWIGEWESCYFSFGIDIRQPLKIASKTPTQLILTQQSPYFWQAQLEFAFDSAFQSDSTVHLTLSGDDGDGVWIHQDRFVCQTRPQD